MRTTRKKFNLILTLAVMLTMTQTTWAVELTKTFSFSTATVTNDYLSIKATDPDDNKQKAILTVNGTMMDVYLNSNPAFEIQNVTSAVSSQGNEVQLFISPYVDGKVTKVEFTKAGRSIQQVGSTFSMSIDGMKYNGTDDALTGVGASGESTSFTFISTDAAGIAGNLTMRLGVDAKFFIDKSAGCEMIITYIPNVEPTHSHDFTFNAVGNTLTATCGHSDGLDCSLADANYQATLTLSPPIESFYRPGTYYSASHNLSAFNTQTGLNGTTEGIRYSTDGTNYTNSVPNAVGDYTARLIVTIGGTNYTLTQSFRVVAYSDINNIYPQFNISTDDYASTTMAGEGQTVTITFTPKFGETLESLTVKGAMTNMSIGSGITSIGNNKYTFTMPAEEVNIGATFSISVDDFAETGENEYTIKTANGWGWFCFATSYDLAPDGFSGKNVKLGTSIESSEMAGTSGHPFKGTFDGQGNTLTFNRTAAEDFCAPFHYINGATISNLHVQGTITGGNYERLSGLVGHSEGNITIKNCRVSTEISTTVSGVGFHGGIIAFWYDSSVECTITGCVYDGLIYNPSEADATTYCSGFIGNLFGSNLTVTFTDCLFAPAAYGTGKYTLGGNCFTFVYPNSDPTYNMTNCYYTSILGNRQGRPAATATVAPANLGNATTDHGMVDGYKNGFFYDGNYYTPKYGDVVVEYRFNDWNERADVTINGTGENLVGVNITEEVGNIKSVTYNRSFNTAQAATVILPFSYICDGNEGGKFYSFAGFNGTTPIMEDGNQVTSLTANTPYLFVPTASTMTFPNITNMTNGVTTLQPTTGDYDVTAGGWTMKGTYSGKSWTEDATDEYILNDDGELELVTAGTTVKPTGAYLVHGVVFSDLELTLPSCLEIVSVNGQKYSGNGHDFSTDDIVVIREKDSYDATNVAANCTIMDNGDGTYTLVISTHNVVVTADATLALTLANSSDNSEAIEHAALIGEEFSSVTLQGRTLYKDGDWNTLTLPFALSAAEIAASPLAGATIMTLNGTTSNLDGEGLLTLNFETAYDPTIAPSGSIVAGRPYIVKWKPQADLFINSADDWNDFCTRVNNGTESYSGKTVRLTSNISVTKMAGTHSNPFCGTFEGDGYTIEVTLDNNGDTGTSDESYGVAPFRFTSGATIRNLHVGGTITTSTRKYAGGIVGKTVSGTNNIQNCWVSAEIYSTINGDGTHGGFVGKASGTVNISNCLFDGVLTTDEVNITHSCGGFVGWRDGALSIDHSMYAPAKLPDGKYTISSNNTCTLTRNNSSSYSAANCLYTQALGTEQGTNASAMSNDDKLDKLGSGWIISNNHVVPKMEVEQMPNIVNPVFSNVTVEDPASTVVSFNGGEFVGNFAPLEITDANRKSIVLLAAGNKLGYAKTDRTIANGKALGACRAYLHIPSISGNAQTARSFVLNFGEENVTTGIIEVNTNKTNKSEGAFNLQGRRIVNPKKGLYIVNGKKIIIK